MEENLFDSITLHIRQGALNKSKSAAFHSQVLLHAQQLVDVDAREFCHRVEMPESYSTEFSKMMRVAEMLKQQGYRVEKRKRCILAPF